LDSHAETNHRPSRERFNKEETNGNQEEGDKEGRQEEKEVVMESWRGAGLALVFTRKLASVIAVRGGIFTSPLDPSTKPA
jgi:hypothetical protein